MKISEKTRTRAARLLRDGESFALFRLPDRTPRLVTGKETQRFSVTPWLCRCTQSVTVGEDDGAPIWDDMPATTPREVYIERVEKLIDRLATRGMAKTVISRVISGCTPEADWIAKAEELWNAFPATLGFLYYTPQTGAWLGASPEKLLTTFPPDHFTTQALAGTMPVGSSWDVKNYQEHQMVIDFIEASLRQLALPYQVGETKTVQFGLLNHLSTHFTGTMPRPCEQRTALLDLLSPTPALAGHPRQKALADIAELEDHERRCYGGYVTVTADGSTFSFVNLRCATFRPDTGQWAVYTGGGITPKSVAANEWDETEAKAARLVEILSK